MALDFDSSVELVITPPDPFGNQLAERIECRVTLGALTQLLARSKERIIISAPFLQRGFGLSAGPMAQALHNAMKRGVNVGILSTARSLRTIDREGLLRGAAGRLELFQPAANIADINRLGSHAKFCVVDGERAYIGSANLTGPGLTEHLEIGLLVQGDIPKKLEELWRYSIEMGLFVRQP